MVLSVGWFHIFIPKMVGNHQTSINKRLFRVPGTTPLRGWHFHSITASQKVPHHVRKYSFFLKLPPKTWELPPKKVLHIHMVGNSFSRKYLQKYGCLPKIVGFPPKSSILIGVFHCKPSILGYPYFWKHPKIGPCCSKVTASHVHLFCRSFC